MIIQEHVEIDGKDFVRTYSDLGMMIHGGNPEADYDEAYDPAECGRTYTETTVTAETPTSEETLDIILGGAS